MKNKTPSFINLHRAPIISRLLALSVIAVLSTEFLDQDSQIFIFTKAHADSNKAKVTEEKLKSINKKIGEVQQKLQTDKGKQKKEQNALKQTELKIIEIEKEFDALSKKQRAINKKLQQLKKEETKLEKSYEKQKKALSKDLRNLYKNGAQEKIKLLLNQENPEDIARILAYYDYYSAARLERILSYQNTLSELNQKQADIEIEIDKLNKVEEGLKNKQDKLEQQKQKRSAVIAGLRTSISDSDQELKSLKLDQNRLSKLLQSLRGIWSDIPSKLNQVAIKTRKGKLPMPVNGKIRNQYGSKRAGGRLTWNGILIEANKGKNIASIHSGRVVFSDWLRGYGMLLIIDHQDGYLSLYGHNSTNLKDTGEWVSTGEVIATVGDTGGQYVPGLYFEMRKDGKPINPKNWIKK